MKGQPEPWYWEARQCWYVQLGKKQVKLDRDEAEARRKWHRIMADHGLIEEGGRRRIPRVDEACEELCSTIQGKREATRRHYAEKLGLFARHFGDRRLDSIKDPGEVIRWIARYQPPARDNLGRPRRRWGDNSRCMQYNYVRMLFKWARDVGYIDRNPFVREPNPWFIRARDRAMSGAEYERVMADPRTRRELKEVVEFVWRAGMRPGEVAVVARSHLDAQKRVVTLQPTEHKTGTRTRAQREIHVPSDLWDRLLHKAEHRRSGPLFRRPCGKPWSSKLISQAFSRARKRLGIGCVLYQARHSYFTNLAESGIPAARAARMGGHRNLKEFMETYYHPEFDQMQEDIEVMTDAEAERMARVRARAEAERAAAEEERRRREREYQANYYRTRKKAPPTSSSDI